MQANTQLEASALCQSCGACCAYSREWPRFSTETDAELDSIPGELVDAGGLGDTVLAEANGLMVRLLPGQP